MLAQKYEEFYTIEDYKHWEGDWELIDLIVCYELDEKVTKRPDRFELDQCTFAFDFSKIWRKRVV